MREAGKALRMTIGTPNSVWWGRTISEGSLTPLIDLRMVGRDTELVSSVDPSPRART